MMREDDPVPDATAKRPSVRAFLRRPEARQILWIALIYRPAKGW
jgi:MFS transporter (putative signal transducer)